MAEPTFKTAYLHYAHSFLFYHKFEAGGIITSLPEPLGHLSCGPLEEEGGGRDMTLPVGGAVLRISSREFLISDYYTAGCPNAKIN